MYDFLWFALGVAVALAATELWRIVFKEAAPSSPHHGKSDAAQPPPKSIDSSVSPETHELALSMAEELASLVSALEGRAHHLIEAAPSRAKLPGAAEAMLGSVDRLRHLHSKLITFGRARPVVSGATDVSELIASIRDELQQMQLGLELRWEPPPELPHINADPEAVRDAMLFVCAALLRAERGATRLTFSTERSFSTDQPTIKVELNLEWITVPGHNPSPGALDQGFALEWEAAKHLVHSYSGELQVWHLPGKSVRAVVRLPIVMVDAPPAASAPEVDETSSKTDTGEHIYGGALVLESDPALRAVLARELKASGRAVFACADGESAHTFLQATPDRFELLIVDDAQQIDEHTPLARTIRAHAPALKICLLTPAPASAPAGWQTVHTLKKPFGVHELRHKLASILETD